MYENLVVQKMLNDFAYSKNFQKHLDYFISKQNSHFQLVFDSITY